MTSHRAEAFGMWSVFVFVTRIFQFYNEDPTGQVSLHCDNEALVNTVNKIITRARPDFPNDTLEADWDIIHEIVLLLRSHDQTVSWIASHQDEETPTEDLPLAAQLNCEADTLADEAHAIRQFHPTAPYCPPNNPIEVYYKNQPIASKIKRNLRQAIKGKPIIDHITTTANWEPETVELVDWDAHTRAISNSKLPAHFVTKFIHNLLPAGKRVHRYKKHYDHHCPSCGAADEDRYHVLTCPERTKWVAPLLKEVQEFCDQSKTNQEFIHLIVDGIKDYLAGNQPKDSSHYPDHLALLVNEQATIGWDQLLLGRMSKLWKKQQNDNLRRRRIKPTRLNSGTGWVSHIIAIIWKNVHQEWLVRNLARHGKDELERSEKRREHHIEELKVYYEYWDDNQLEISDDLAPMFYPNFEAHIEKESSLLQLDTWLNTYRDIINNSIRKHPTQAEEQQFSPTSSSNSSTTNSSTCSSQSLLSLTDFSLNSQTSPILTQPSTSRSHGSTDTHSAALVSRNHDTVAQFNTHNTSTVSTQRESEVNANAERNAAATETQENTRKTFEGSKICPPNLVT